MTVRPSGPRHSFSNGIGLPLQHVRAATSLGVQKLQSVIGIGSKENQNGSTGVYPKKKLVFPLGFPVSVIIPELAVAGSCSVSAAK